MHPWIRWLALGIGVALLVAAVVAVGRRQDAVTAALAAIRRPSPLHVAVLLGTIPANIALTSIVYRLLLSRYGRVGGLEMGALIASAALLNYLPLRAGLLGRVAYQRVVCRIAVVDSAKTVVQAMTLSAISAAYLAGVALVGRASPIAGVVALLAPVPVLAVAGLAPARRVWCWALLVRGVEVVVWAVRYYVAFDLLERSIGASTALAMAVAGGIAALAPVAGNGLGIREWAIGLLAPVLTPYALEIGITADLLNRAAEVIVIPLAGVPALLYLARRRREAKDDERAPADSNDTGRDTNPA
jgi:hypothetical protein